MKISEKYRGVFNQEDTNSFDEHTILSREEWDKNENNVELKFSSLQELPSIAQQIIQFAGDAKIWLFEGQMAAGKTTLIKEICKQLGVVENVGSPTYSLVNEYVTDKKKIIYHFDFYRLKSEMEALDYGLEEYFDSQNLCLCEWPSMIPNLLPDEYLLIKISVESNAGRQISLDLYQKILP